MRNRFKKARRKLNSLERAGCKRRMESDGVCKHLGPAPPSEGDHSIGIFIFTRPPSSHGPYVFVSCKSVPNLCQTRTLSPGSGFSTPYSHTLFSPSENAQFRDLKPKGRRLSVRPFDVIPVV